MFQSGMRKFCTTLSVVKLFKIWIRPFSSCVFVCVTLMMIPYKSLIFKALLIFNGRKQKYLLERVCLFFSPLFKQSMFFILIYQLLHNGDLKSLFLQLLLILGHWPCISGLFEDVCRMMPRQNLVGLPVTRLELMASRCSSHMARSQAEMD